MKENLKILTNGLLKENPSLRLVLGTCPTLAITTLAFNGLGMGLAATFVTILQMVVKAFMPELDAALGIYLPLIVVNCIILGRAEMFASKHGVFASALDGLGMGLGFTLTLVCMGSIREILGAGTWFGMRIIPESIDSMTVFITPPGG